MFGLFLQPPKPMRNIALPIDLLAFYCGARVLPADPYLIEPLRSCQHDAFRLVTGRPEKPYLVVPAPLPPFALSILRPIGAMSFPMARAVWLVSIILVSIATIFWLCRLADIPPLLISAVVAVGITIPCLLLGQLVPFVLAALCGAALALQMRRWTIASFLAALSLFEPHIGGPVCLTLALLIPPCRRSLVIFVSSLALISLGSGVERNLEYVTVVLPAHAQSEGTSFIWQYSLSALLAQIGMPQRLALVVGTLSYVGMVGLAILTARRLVGILGSSAALVIPSAFVLLGGTFIHIHQMAFAIPLIVLLYPKHRQSMTLVLAGVSIPWYLIQQSGVVNWIFPPTAPNDYHTIVSSLQAASSRGHLAEDVWSAWVRSSSKGAGSTLELLLFKLPSWIALVALVAFTTTYRRTGAHRLNIGRFSHAVDADAHA
jgi:hypothetical protein